MSVILPSLNKKYHNLRIILDKLNISSLDYTVSEDLKVLLQMVRKQTASSKHPCTFCMTSSQNYQKTDHYTLESLCRLYNKWMADGAKLKKAKKYANVVHLPLSTGDKNKKNTRICKYSWSTYTVRCCLQNFKRKLKKFV